jgi:hypothetical protein
VATEDERDRLRYVLTDEADDARPRSLVSLLCALPPNVAEVLDSVTASCRGKGEFPVVVLPELRPDLTAVSSVPIEFIPTRRHLFVLNVDDYERYVRRRWSLIATKWCFASEIVLGANFDEFVEAQLRSDLSVPRETAAPLRPTPLPAPRAAAYSP